MQSRLIGVLGVVHWMSIEWFGLSLEGQQLQIYMVWWCWWRDFEQKIDVRIGLEEEQTGKEVQDVEQIDRGISFGALDKHWMVFVDFGELVD